jgi:hypothetical protein
LDVSRSRRVFECLTDVLALQVGILLEDGFNRPPSGNETDHGFDGDPEPADARPATELGGVNRDAIEHHRESPVLGTIPQQRRAADQPRS